MAVLSLNRAAGDVLKPGDQRARQIDAGGKHQREMRKQRHVGGFDRSRAAGRLAESHVAHAQHQGAEGDQQAEHERDGEQRLARECRADDQELAHEDAERRQAGDGDDAEHETPAEQRVALGQAADLGDLLRALDLRDVADGKEDRRLGQASASSCAAARRNWRAVRPCRRRR